MSIKIRYGSYEDAWWMYERLLIDTIDQLNIKNVLDVGAGANPMMKDEFIQQHDIDYSILDISETELQKAPGNHKKIIADVTSSQFSPGKKFDLVFSKTLVEHIENPEQFHKNMLQILNEGGLAIHFFPTLYAFPFLVNFILSKRITDRLFDIFSPRDRHQYQKFPAYYLWCRGPFPHLIRKYESLGYEVVEYVGFFGHNYYIKIPLLHKLQKRIVQFLIKHPNPFLTSYAYIILKKVN